MGIGAILWEKLAGGKKNCGSARATQPRLLNSVRSHALASFQSRMTVSTDTLTTSAVSSTLSPPKKRNSTIWALRGSTLAKVFSASSRAISSRARPEETSSAASRSKGSCLPPRRARTGPLNKSVKWPIQLDPYRPLGLRVLFMKLPHWVSVQGQKEIVHGKVGDLDSQDLAVVARGAE